MIQLVDCQKFATRDGGEFGNSESEFGVHDFDSTLRVIESVDRKPKRKTARDRSRFRVRDLTGAHRIVGGPASILHFWGSQLFVTHVEDVYTST